MTDEQLQALLSALSDVQALQAQNQAALVQLQETALQQLSFLCIFSGFVLAGFLLVLLFRKL